MNVPSILTHGIMSHRRAAHLPHQSLAITEIQARRRKQKRLPPLHDEEIAGAIRHLNVLRWLDVHPSVDLPLPEEALFDA